MDKRTAPAVSHQAGQTREIPEFTDVRQHEDGSWTARHKGTGEVITAGTFEQLECVQAPIVRIARALSPLRTSATPFCLGCGQEVRRREDGMWATRDDGTVCVDGKPHRVGPLDT